MKTIFQSNGLLLDDLQTKFCIVIFLNSIKTLFVEIYVSTIKSKNEKRWFKKIWTFDRNDFMHRLFFNLLVT
jgi:hypothetical protein